jgi:GNAT superfamily N-acetyltransferase
MSNYQQAELAAPLDDVVRDNPNVLGYGITSTQGLFMNEAERSLNAEFVVGKGFDPAPLRLRVVELGKEYNQDSVLFSKVVEEGAPNARPGVEIYFKEKLPEEAMNVIVNRLMERGVDGFTYITDSRFSDKINRQFRSGNQPDNAGITGIRFQYVPEFDESFVPQKATEMYKDKLDSFSDIVGDIILDETKLKIGKNSEVTLGGNVSDARIVHYDTEVFFRGDYDDYIAKHTRPDDSQTGGGRSGGSNNEKANRGSKEGAGPPRAVRDGVGGATSTKANEEITALNIYGYPLGINVAVDKNGTDYADLIVNGTKKFESRETPSLKPYVGKRVGIVRTGAGPAEVIGSVEIGQPIEVNQRDFNKLRDQHLVAEDSSFNIKKGQTKFLYPMIDPMTTAPQKVTSKGIVARAVPAAMPAQQALPKVDPSLPKYEGMRDATVQHLKNKGIMSQREFDRAERDSFEKTGNWDSMPEPEAVYTIDDSGSNSSYVTIKKPKNYVEEGIGDPDEYTIRFSDHSLPKQYAYDQNIYNVSDDYYDETINGKTLNDAIDYADRLVPSSSVALGETPSVRDGARSALRDIGENAPTNPQTSIEQISQDIESRYGLDSFTAYEKGDDVTLGMITVPKDKRKQGVGSAAMNDLIEYADTNNKRVKLTPDVKGSDQGTTSRKRLVDFYKRFGFVENKGRNKDFTVSEGMFRLPKSR